MSGIVSGLNRGGDNSTGLVNQAAYPAHSIVQSVLLSGEKHAAAHISSTSSSYTNSGMYGSFRPKFNSNQTWLKVHYHCGMQQFQTNTVEMDCTFDNVNSTSYAEGDSLGSTSPGGDYNNRFTGTGNNSGGMTWTFANPPSHQGSHEEIQTPTNQTSYDAGFLYYVRLYYKTDGGTFYFVHQDTYWNLFMEEIMKPGVGL